MGRQPEKTAYAVKLLAITENRTGMIAGITGAISDMKTGIRDARASVAPDERGHIEVTVEVFDVKHLDKVINSIKGVPGVLDVERMQGAVCNQDGLNLRSIGCRNAFDTHPVQNRSLRS